MNARMLLQKYAIDIEHLPNPRGMNVVQIQGIDTEEYEAREGGRLVRKVRHQLWLTGFRLPLRLNNTRVEVLRSLLGDDTDQWIGRKIGLYVGAVQRYGRTEEGILLHIQPIDQSQPAVSQAPLNLALPAAVQAGIDRFAASIAASRQGQGQTQALPAGAGEQADTRPIGDAAAKRFVDHLASLGTNYDGFLRHCKLHDRPAFEAAAGVAVAELPRWLLPAMKRYLDTVSAPAQAGQVDRATGEVIDPTSIPGVRRGIAEQPSATPPQHGQAASPRIATGGGVPPADIPDDPDIPF